MLAIGDSQWHQSAIYMSKNGKYSQLPPFAWKFCDASLTLKREQCVALGVRVGQKQGWPD